jgi:class 3 adenylate cyclase
MCGGALALALAQLKSVDQFVRSAPSTETQPFSLESGGERKHVTVLFADIVSSTRLIEGLDPEDAYEILQPTIRIMMDAVHRFGGTVNQVLGDGIMALFGARSTCPYAGGAKLRRGCRSRY